MLDARRSFDNAAPAADRRGGLRAAPSSLLHATFGSQHGGVVLNLSEGGFAVATALSLLDRVVPHITITLGPGDDKIKVVGLTVWTTEATQRAGFQFIGLEASQRERIRNWVRLHNPDACEIVDSDEAPAIKRVWSANPHLLPLNAIPDQTFSATPDLPQSLPMVLAAQPVTESASSQPTAAFATSRVGKNTRIRISLSVAAAFIIGSALTFFGAPRWSDHSSAAERASAAHDSFDDQAQTFLPDPQGKALSSQADQSVLILPAASTAPYRASLLKEELPSPASVRIVSQRSLYLPNGVFHDAGNKSVSAKSLVPGRLLTEIVPDFPVLHADSAAPQLLRVRAHVDETGKVVEVFPISGPTALMPAISKAVAKWRYEPTLLDGQPVQIQVDLAIQSASAVQ